MARKRRTKDSLVSSKLIEIMVSFDTTGSMYTLLSLVRRVVTQLVGNLFKEIPNLRMGVIVHGDYCDRPPHGPYVTKMLNLTANQGSICKFVREAKGTDGGDLPECYELVLHEARTKVSWTAGATKVLIIIGDNVPHGPNYPGNIRHIDWRNELGLLLDANINVYGVHALGYMHARGFYEEIAKKTGGFCLELDQFRHVQDAILAICYKQIGDVRLQQFEQAVISSGRMDRGLDMFFSVLIKRAPSEDYGVPMGLKPVPAGRFQVLDVDEDLTDENSKCPIKKFVKENDLKFRTGKGFYELMKPELIQETKEVVLWHRLSGAMFTGEEARQMIGLPFGQRGKINPRNLGSDLDDFIVFVQSTSHNRNLIENTRFLYEVEDWVEED